MLEVESIVTKFGEQVVHDGVSFSISEPSITAIIGGSGCGKSVLLREILGLIEPQAGTIRLLGIDATRDRAGISEVRKRIGVLFQNGALFSALTVEQNLAMPLIEHTDLDPHLISELAELRLALAGLAPAVLAKKPSELSGGMRKRVALARALALEPEFLFLDEPTSGLDPIGARAFDQLIRTLCNSLGLAVLLVTHDLDTLESIVDRIIVLGEGRVLADGTPQEVRGSTHPWIQQYFSSRAARAAS